MASNTGIVGAEHKFHDKGFANDWADRFTPTVERLQLFNTILSELQSRIPGNGCLVELGIGPGYLADYLLNALPDVSYCGIDFSPPMIEIAKNRLEPYSTRLSYIHADLVKENWENQITEPIDAIITTWSLHDLGSQKFIGEVYKKCANVLTDSGILLNGDFIKPEGTAHEFEPGRFEVSKHQSLLRDAGFRDTDCLIYLEEELNSPTAAQNYVCLIALK